jgi:predicted phage terminase large subunit-like protein
MRDKTWDWFTDDFMTRFTEDAGILGIMTRWHLDDPFGRLMAVRPEARVKRYPALAEHDEEPRRAGEPLFPELKSLEFLLRQKETMKNKPASWESLYQQNPIVVGGDLFRDEWWQFRDSPPRTLWRAIYVDTAQKTKEVNDYSVFQCWGATEDGQAVLLDQLRGRWEAPELLEVARAFWAKHKAVTGMGRLRKMPVEDKVSGTGLIQTLRREGIPVLPVQRNVDKVTRAMDTGPLVQSGNVILVRGVPHLSDLLAETSAFPNGTHDDTVDAMMDAVEDICGADQRKSSTTW